MKNYAILEKDDEIRAEYSFYERSLVDKKRANGVRQSPECNEMYGVEILETTAAGTTRRDTYWWGTKERRNQCLMRIKARYVNPQIKYIGLK